MERYKGHLVPLSVVKSGSLIKRLAARGHTTSDDILHAVTKPDSNKTDAIGPLTSTEELLEALDLAIGSGREDLEGRTAAPETESAFTRAETEASGDAVVAIPTRRKRRTKKEIEAGVQTHEPKFVELTKLLPPVPKKGSFEVNAVRKSLYFFS
jgi:DNA-directed RNA polymerase